MEDTHVQDLPIFHSQFFIAQSNNFPSRESEEVGGTLIGRWEEIDTPVSVEIERESEICGI